MHDHVVLIAPPAFRRGFRDTRQQPPLGLAFIARHLRDQGVGCSIIDGYTFSLSPESIIKRTMEERPALIGVTTSTLDRFSAISLIRQLKAALPETMILGGGQHFTYSAEDALRCIPELDFVCRGDGELTTAALFRELAGGRDFAKVPGLAFREGDAIRLNPKQREYADFNALAPAWELFDLNRYNGTLTLADHTRAIGVISSRGCDNHCVYCANALNRCIRYKDPARFADEVEELVREHNFAGINIQDDSFTSSFEHVEAICDEFLRRDLRISWYCSLRLDEVTRAMLEKMKAAGCVGLGFGIESGSEPILKNIRKGTNVGMILDVVHMVTELGFAHVGMFVITSLPGETPETFLESQEVLNRIYGMVNEHWERQPVLGSLAQIYPGTALEALAKRRGVLPRDFSWNSPYENPKFGVFNVSQYVPHFEEPDFPVEAIKQLVQEKFPGKTLYIC